MTAAPRPPFAVRPALAATAAVTAALALALALAGAAPALAAGAAPAASSASAGSGGGGAGEAGSAAPGTGEWAVVRGATDAADWAPVTPAKWAFPGTEVILTEKGADPGPPRRPFEYAVLTAGPRFGALRLDAEVRIDAPVSVDDRDVILVFGYRSPTRYYYAHLSQDNTIYAHNGIFKVDGADRERIDDQWDGATGAAPAITDADYHPVSLRHDPATGRIRVYVDGARRPLMTATDTTFGSGRVGFGSFDNHGRLRGLSVVGRVA